MQKRRTISPVLPVTGDDAAKAGSILIRRNTKSIRNELVGLVKLLFGILGVAMMVVLVQRQTIAQTSSEDEAEVSRMMKDAVAQEEREQRRLLPLAEFSSLQYALDRSQLVALYFAASWCPMSTPVTNLIDKLLRDMLLPPPATVGKQRTPTHGNKLALVYVSSDTSAAEMTEYMRPNWMAVPYESEERNNLKRHFSTSAKRELGPLNMERKHEIPTLLLLSGETHQPITYDGIQDLKEYGVEAVQHWLELERVTAGLDSKYQ